MCCGHTSTPRSDELVDDNTNKNIILTTNTVSYAHMNSPVPDRYITQLLVHVYSNADKHPGTYKFTHKMILQSSGSCICSLAIFMIKLIQTHDNSRTFTQWQDCAILAFMYIHVNMPDMEYNWSPYQLCREVVMKTIFGATSDEEIGAMTTFDYQWWQSGLDFRIWYGKM